MQESDEQTETHLQNMIETIDEIVFTGHPIPQHFSEELAEECRVWRQKFEEKTQRFSLMFINK